MSYIPIDYAQIRLEIQIPGDAGPAYVIFGVDAVPASVTSTAAAVQASLGTIAPGIISMYTSDCVITDMETRQRIDPVNVAVTNTTLNLVGGGTPPSSPPNVAALVSKESGVAGRSNRGRMYFPGVGETSVDNGGFLTTGAIGFMQAGIDQVLSDLATNAVPMVILHTNPAQTPTPVQSVVVRPKVATQRRRLR